MTSPLTDVASRPAPRRTLLNPTVLRIELRRLVRNRRILIFTFVFPAVMLVFIGSQITGQDDVIGPQAVANVGAYVMASMAVYGAVMATTSAGASVSIERAAGWSRQLRLTPARPLSHVLVKMLVAVVLGVCATVVTFVVGAVTGTAHVTAMAPWWQMGVVIVLGSLVFAAFGLFMGYLLPSENAMQFLGPLLAILAIFGGLFSGPLPTDSLYGQIAQYTPIYGLSQLAHWPLTLTTTGAHDPFRMAWVLNLVVWGLVFVAGAVWRFRRDTDRV
ncbi:MAG: ABC transporter permease [Micrococcales bacterium]|uniref:ABC transporter permease n=1 Tax=Phycicoccus sp. TaxID=1902410 RepID=UPI00198FF89F|nr:ABC transporter permease [Phycicoccus sp.]MBD3784377.1 ABC transporter permease [Micrococcales bacterium]HMM93817.1 ABC transporter permease [Phycicoccus sp.]